MSTCSITHTTKKPFPKHPYEVIKNDILGKRYTLALNFIGEVTAQKLNREYRKKEYVPNVLSFPLTETDGEIFICPVVAKRQAKKFGMSTSGYIGFLFIHGCLHLKGHLHGATMDTAEQRYCKKYQLQ